MAESPLINRLEAIRRSVHRRLIFYGACAVAGGGILSFLTVVTLDWLFWLPGVPRIVITMMFLAGFVMSSWHWIIKPLQARIGIDEIAARLEDRFDDLNDSLSSTVHFLTREDPASPTLIRQVITATEGRVGGLPLESVLTLKPLARSAISLVLAGCFLSTVLLVSPGWAAMGMKRYLSPFGDAEWPRKVSILPLTGDLTVAVGESALVRMQVSRGMQDSLRAVVHLREADGHTLSLTMRRDGEDVFDAVIYTVTTDMEYWFEAGDDDTRRSPGMITAARRPEVVEAIASIEPPPYAANRPVRVQELGEEALVAPLGGYVNLSIRSSKPVARSPGPGKLGLRSDDWFLPLQPNAESPRELSARIPVTGDIRLRIHLVDEEGFENIGAKDYLIRAVPDEAPTVIVMEPRSMVEVTPNGSVNLSVRVEDDFGITDFGLETQLLSEAATGVVPLMDQLTVDPEGERVTGLANYGWALAPLSLSPGDVVIYHVVARDNKPLADGVGQIGRSAPLRIRVISDFEFGVRVRDDLALLEKRLREVVLDQSGLLDQTNALPSGEKEEGLSPADLEVAAAMAAAQTRLSRLVQQLAKRFSDLGERMDRNSFDDSQTRSEVARLEAQLDALSRGPMTSAGGTLREATEEKDPAAQNDLLERTIEDQKEAVEKLRELIRSMSQWGDFHGLLTRARDLLDRQRNVREETAEFGKDALGKSVESLDADEKASLARLRRRQEQLADDLEGLMEQMEQMAEGSKEADPSASQSVEDAMRAAKARNLSQRMRDAAKALESNRTAAAALEQKSAEEAMEEMVSALQEREERELALLRKHLDEAEQQVEDLLEEQQALRAATEETAQLPDDDPAYLTNLRRRQRTLKRNTELVAGDISDTDKAAIAAALVRQAAEPMGRAEEQLRQNDPGNATTDQDDAIVLLERALDELRALKQEAAEQALNRSLGKLLKELEAMLASQQKVNQGIAELRTEIDSKGRITRAEARRAARLATDQAAVLKTVNDLQPQLEDAVVYQWAMERVEQWMDTSVSALRTRKIDDDLTTTTARIVRELERLIAAIRATQALPPPSEFTDETGQGGGGGGGSGGGQKAAVPPIAELMVLKAMQTAILERTTEINDAIDPDNPSEAQLKELQFLGEDQEQVRALSEKMTQKARQP